MLSGRLQAVEQTLADTLLSCLSGVLDATACIVEVEARTAAFFQHRRESGGLATSATILEAIAVFIERRPDFRHRALSCMLILSLCNPSSWNLLAHSSAFERFPELVDLNARCLSGEDLFSEHFGRVVSEQVAFELLNLCDIACWEHRCRLRYIPSTPASLAIAQLCHACKEPARRSDAAKQIYLILRRIPESVFVSIPSDILLQAFDHQLASSCDVEILKRPVQIAALSSATAVEEIDKLINKYPDSPLRDWVRILNTTKTGAIAVVPARATSMREAFRNTTEILDGSKDKDIIALAKYWLSTRQYGLVAEAYIAAPNLLHRTVEGRMDICIALRDIPLSLRSPVDDDIDNALARILSTVPELAVLLSRRGDGNALLAERSLMKMALIHPYLLCRRLECLFAVCNTILHGMTDAEYRYQNSSLRVLIVLFDVFRKMPTECLRLHPTENICSSVLRFVVDENRLENGVPGQFEELVQHLFKTFALLPKEQHGSFWKSVLPKVIQGKGTCETIKDAATNLLMTL